MNYATVDYQATHPPVKGDFWQLYALTQQLVGEKVLFGALSYPNELTIHFGAAVEVKGPRGVILHEGTYILGTVASGWRIKSAPQGRTVFGRAFPVAESYGAGFPRATQVIDEVKFEEFLKRVGGATVRAVDLAVHLHGYVLGIWISDGSIVEVYPLPDHFEIGPEDPIPVRPPDWELFTPYKRYLRVGPGEQWAYLPTDVLEEVKPKGT
ncbi:MAG: hypothetical protein U0871_07415 [Gemmataceae bacterium]